MKKYLLLTFMALPVFAADLDLTGTSTYYKVHPQFHPYPEEGKAVQSIDRFGPVGIGIHLLQPAFQMQVKNVEPGSPAETAGKLKQGQIIDSINGRVLKDMDPRQILGDIIAKAETADGVVKLVVRENATAQPVEVIVNIPVLGAYGKTWPLNDAKSDQPPFPRPPVRPPALPSAFTPKQIPSSSRPPPPRALPRRQLTLEGGDNK